jgi:hypothetical protein
MFNVVSNGVLESMILDGVFRGMGLNGVSEGLTAMNDSNGALGGTIMEVKFRRDDKWQ